MITPLPIHEIYASPATQKLVGSDLFEKLIPLAVVELGSVYTEEMAKLVRTEADKCEGAEGEAESGLNWIGLPKALERFQDLDGGMADLLDPGKQAREWAEEIRSQESTREGPIQQILAQVDRLKFSTLTKLNTLAKALEQESFECEQVRNQFGSAFEQLPSAQFTKPFRTDLSSHQSTMSQAENSDGQVNRIYEGIKSDIKILSSSNEVLAQHFAEIITSDPVVSNKQVNLLDLDVSSEDISEQEKEETRALVQKVQDGMSRLRKVRKERADVLKDLKERVS